MSMYLSKSLPRVLVPKYYKSVHKAMRHELLSAFVKKIRYDINNELERTEMNSGNAKVIFQTGLTGSTGCVLSFNTVIEKRVA